MGEADMRGSNVDEEVEPREELRQSNLVAHDTKKLNLQENNTDFCGKVWVV